MKNHRPQKPIYYLEIAKTVAQRGTCLRRNFGAIIVKNDAIISTGYCGSARGVVNCLEVGCIKDLLNLPHGRAYDECISVHAEENAIINAARNGSSTVGGTLYIAGINPDGTLTEAIPCDRCKRAIINAGIEKVVILTKDGKAKEILVSEWVKEDTENYLKKLKNAKDQNYKT